MPKNNLIYALRDPRTDEVRYVGKSTSGLKRPESHFTFSHNLKVQDWVNELKSENLLPEIDILEECDDWPILTAKERFWIDHYLESGSNLLNDIFSDRNEKKQILLSKLEKEIEKKIEELESQLLYIKKKNDSLQSLGSFIAIMRKEKRITQKDLAELTGLSERTIRDLERNFGGTALSSILKCLDVLGFTLQPVIKQIEKRKS